MLTEHNLNVHLECIDITLIFGKFANVQSERVDKIYNFKCECKFGKFTKQYTTKQMYFDSDCMQKDIRLLRMQKT